MSLDARIRQLAAEAVADAGTTGGDSGSAARVTELEQQLADHQAQMKDLHDHQHRALTTIQRMEKRLDALENLEKTTGQTNQESRPAARRTSRKESTE